MLIFLFFAFLSNFDTMKNFIKKYLLLYKKKYPVDFDDELKIGDVRYDDMT